MNIGFDIIFLAVLAASTAGCFFLGEEKSQRLMIGVLVGGLAANMLAVPLAKLMPDNFTINPGLISVGMIVICVVIVLVGKNVRDSKWPRSKFKAVVSGFLAGFAGLSLAITSMPEVTRSQLTTEHNLAAIAYDLRLLSVGALIIWLLASYLMVGKAKK